MFLSINDFFCQHHLMKYISKSLNLNRNDEFDYVIPSSNNEIIFWLPNESFFCIPGFRGPVA